MTRYVRRELGALAQALFCTDSGPPTQAHVDWVVEDAADFLQRAGARTRFVLTFSLLAVVWLSALCARRLRSLSRLSLAERVAALERLERSPFSPPLLGVKALLSLLYYEHPEAARRVGFDGRCLTDES